MYTEETPHRSATGGGDPSYLRFYWRLGLFLCLGLWFAITVDFFSAWLGLNSIRIFTPEGAISPTILGAVLGIGGCLFFGLPFVSLISESALGQRAMRLVCPALVIDAVFVGPLAIGMFGLFTIVYAVLAPVSLLLAVPVLLFELLLASDAA